MEEEALIASGREFFDQRLCLLPRQVVTAHQCDHCRLFMTRFAPEGSPPAEGSLCTFCRVGRLSPPL